MYTGKFFCAMVVVTATGNTAHFPRCENLDEVYQTAHTQLKDNAADKVMVLLQYIGDDNKITGHDTYTVYPNNLSKIGL